MNRESLDHFILDFMLNASHLALVERAEGTSALIENFYTFFRYYSSKRVTSLLEDELDNLKKFMRLKRISEEKIELNIRGVIPADTEVRRMCLIDRIDDMLNEFPAEELSTPTISVEFSQENRITAEIRISSNKKDIQKEVVLS